MGKFNKRTQVLLSEEEYKRLKELSIREHKSISLLIREAVHNTFVEKKESKKNIVQNIIKLDLPVNDWETMKLESIYRYCRTLPLPYHYCPAFQPLSILLFRLSG